MSENEITRGFWSVKSHDEKFRIIAEALGCASEVIASNISSLADAQLLVNAPRLLYGLQKLSATVSDIINGSDGVAGYLSNGDVAKWDELDLTRWLIYAEDIIADATDKEPTPAVIADLTFETVNDNIVKAFIGALLYATINKQSGWWHIHFYNGSDVNVDDLEIAKLRVKEHCRSFVRQLTANRNENCTKGESNETL